MAGGWWKIITCAASSEQRAQHLRSHTAAERYELLQRSFFMVFQRMAVQHIASHLGMAPETLSRLRNKLA